MSKKDQFTITIMDTDPANLLLMRDGEIAQTYRLKHSEKFKTVAYQNIIEEILCRITVISYIEFSTWGRFFDDFLDNITESGVIALLPIINMAFIQVAKDSKENVGE